MLLLYCSIAIFQLSNIVFIVIIFLMIKTTIPYVGLKDLLLN